MTTNGSEPDVRALVDELKKLRQGPAVVDGAKKDALSPVLYAAFGVHEADDDATVRAKMFGRMRAAIEVLREAEREAVAAAFGLTPGYRGRFYKDRVNAFAKGRAVDPRTVRRWVDRGLESLARSLLAFGGETEQKSAWWTDRLQLVLALDEPEVEALEVRRVVAARDGVAELDLAMTLTDADPALVLEGVSIRVLYGGRLRVGPMESSDRVGMVLALPKRLRQGETHEYAMRIRLPSDYAMRPHYVCVPRYPCQNLDLHVRFPADDLPRRVDKLVDVYQRDIDDDAVVAEQVPVDGAGEVHVRFTDLNVDRATGVRWQR